MLKNSPILYLPKLDKEKCLPLIKMSSVRKNRYIENLSSAVLPLSLSQDIKEACKEWVAYRYIYLHEGTTCICGKEDIRRVYEIYNETTDELLYPIGSKCIKKFDNESLNTVVRVLEQHSKDLFKYGKYAGEPQALEWIYENDYQWIEWLRKHRMPSSKKSVNNAYQKLFNYTEVMDRMTK